MIIEISKRCRITSDRRQWMVETPRAERWEQVLFFSELTNAVTEIRTRKLATAVQLEYASELAEDLAWAEREIRSALANRPRPNAGWELQLDGPWWASSDSRNFVIKKRRAPTGEGEASVKAYGFFGTPAAGLCAYLKIRVRLAATTAEFHPRLRGALQSANNVARGCVSCEI
jgi:hypothetical protein